MSQDPLPIIIYKVTDGLNSLHTKDSYRKSFRQFLKAEQTTEKDLLTLASQSPRHVEAKIVNHIRRLANAGLAHGSIKTNCFSIFHFFEMNDVILNKRKIIRFLPPDEGTREDRAYTHQEIQDILNQANERSRVMILLMASTGMRIGALSYIQIGDLAKIEEYGLYRIKVYANSPKDRYYTFCTLECAAAIDSYLEYRQRFGEMIKPQAPLIREQFNTRFKDPFRIATPKILTENAITTEIKTVLKRSGKRAKNVKQSHGFRKFAITQMIKAKTEYGSREYLVGHRRSRGLDVNYDRTTEQDRLQEYLKAVDLLTINPENRLKLQIHQMQSEHSEEWNQLKREMLGLKEILGRLNH